MEMNINDAKAVLAFYMKLEQLDDWKSVHKNAINFLRHTGWNHCIAHVYFIKYLVRTKQLVKARAEIKKLLAHHSVLGRTDDGDLVAQPPELPLSLFHRFPDLLAYARQSNELESVQDEAAGQVTPTKVSYALSDFGGESLRFDPLVDTWPKDWRDFPFRACGARRAYSLDEKMAIGKEEIAASTLRDILHRAGCSDLSLKRSRKEGKVLTFGSCFAVNLVDAFRAHGIDARNLRVEEAINSPLANRFVLEYLFRGKHQDNPLFNDMLPRESRPDVVRHVKEADAIVVTIGVALAFFLKESAPEMPFFAKNYGARLKAREIYHRITTVEENTREIELICDLIRAENPDARIFLTLSPIPLQGAAVGRSVVEADVLSKSILRSSIEQASKTRSFCYWPSFELIKWIAPHIDPELGYRPYGSDDGNSRHASYWLTNQIVQEFCDCLFPDKE